MVSRTAFYLFLLGMGLSLPAVARITCCDVDGKRTCGDPAPLQCISRAKTEFGKGGVKREVEAPPTPEQIAAREEEAARAAEEKRKADELARRDRALRDSYTSPKDIDSARDRAVKEIDKNAEQAKNRLESAQKKQAKLVQEKEFYQKKPLPPDLQSQIKDNEAEIAAQQKTLQQIDADKQVVRDRFDADKKRYIEITGKK